MCVYVKGWSSYGKPFDQSVSDCDVTDTCKWRHVMASPACTETVCCRLYNRTVYM